jgi:hypothetical protein
MRISMLVRRESRVSSRAIQGGNKSNLSLEADSDILDHPLQHLDRSSSQSTEILQRPIRIASTQQTSATWWYVPCSWEHIQTRLKLPFDGYQKLTLMIKMELENVTDVVPKDDYEFQMNVSLNREKNSGRCRRSKLSSRNV